MPSLEEFPICLALRYEWKLKETRKSENHSNEFKFRNISSFRVRLKHFGRRYACLFFYTANLHKLGLKVTGVSFSSGNGKIRDVEMKEFAYSEAVKNGGLQLFDVFMGCITHCASFNFTVYLSNIIPAYQVEQIDAVQREKLWSASGNENGTDFKLQITGGKSFPVHKFVLAARSPVFAAQFITQQNQEEVDQVIMDFDVDETCMKQFLKFIYTGELDGPVTSQLVQLATHYKIETLEKICQAAAPDIKVLKDALFAFPSYRYNREWLDGLVSNMSEIKPPPGVNPSKILILKGEWIISESCWKVGHYGNTAGRTAKSEPFQFGNRDIFRAQIKTTNSEETDFNLTFHCYGHKSIGCNIIEVFYSTFRDGDPLKTKRVTRMKEIRPTRSPSLKVFTSRRSTFNIPIRSINFTVKLMMTSNLSNQCVDFKWKEQLWSSCANKLLTDVEFLIEDQSFAAHRQLLSVHSPVFAAMFQSGMKEAETGKVKIDDVDSTTFQLFLEFLYTGTFKSSPIDTVQLYSVADKYQVEALMDMCRIMQLVDGDGMENSVS